MVKSNQIKSKIIKILFLSSALYASSTYAYRDGPDESLNDTPHEVLLSDLIAIPAETLANLNDAAILNGFKAASKLELFKKEKKKSGIIDQETPKTEENTAIFYKWRNEMVLRPWCVLKSNENSPDISLTSGKWLERNSPEAQAILRDPRTQMKIDGIAVYYEPYSDNNRPKQDDGSFSKGMG